MKADRRRQNKICAHPAVAYRPFLSALSFVLAACGPTPKNDVTLQQIAENYPQYVGKSVKLQVTAVAPSSYFNYAFAGMQSTYWSVEVNDGSRTVYAYFAKEKFTARRWEIAFFKDTRITLTATIAGTIAGAGFPNSLLEVTEFEDGWP